MTPEELKKIARLFAYETSNGDALDPHIDFAEEYAVEVLQWLSKNYCLVEKSKVKEVYDNHIDRIKGGFVYVNPQVETYMRASLASAMWRLFGKDMFEEE